MKKLYLLLFCLILLWSCSKETCDSSVFGTVSQINGTGQPIGIADVSVVMNEYGSSKNKTTTTDSNGYYNFSPIAPDEYNLTFSKAGYTTKTVTNVEAECLAGSNVIGGADVSPILLYSPCTNAITNLLVTDSSGLYIISGKITPATKLNSQLSIVVYISNSPSVSSLDNISSFVTTATTDSSFKYTINLYNYFATGSTVYMQAYATYAIYVAGSSQVNFSPPYYTSSTTGKIVYEGIGAPSNVVNLKLP